MIIRLNVELKRNTAGQMVHVLQEEESTGNLLGTYGENVSQLTWAVYVSKDGAAYVLSTTSVFSLMSGPSGCPPSHCLFPSQADTDAVFVSFLVVPTNYVNNQRGIVAHIQSRSSLKDFVPTIHSGALAAVNITSPTSAKVTLATLASSAIQYGARITFPTLQVSADIGALNPTTKEATLSNPGSVAAHRAAYTTAGMGAVGTFTPTGFVPTLDDPMGIFAALTAGIQYTIEAP